MKGVSRSDRTFMWNKSMEEEDIGNNGRVWFHKDDKGIQIVGCCIEL